MNRVRSLIAASLIVSIAGLAVPLPAQAGMITTEQAATSAARARLNGLLERADLQAKLAAYGVKASDVKARIAALSDDEVAQLSAQIDNAPAGGDAAGAIIGAALIVFLVLLLTDILGYTHVFPFTKNMRR
jgi:uncharacterized small protein (DUF1192 family)